VVLQLGGQQLLTIKRNQLVTKWTLTDFLERPEQWEKCMGFGTLQCEHHLEDLFVEGRIILK
jgi:hypothetical protein